MTPAPVLRALVTGTPPHRTTQQEIKEAVTGIFPRLAARKTVLDVFDNAQIESRALLKLRQPQRRCRVQDYMRSLDRDQPEAGR